MDLAEFVSNCSTATGRRWCTSIIVITGPWALAAGAQLQVLPAQCFYAPPPSVCARAQLRPARIGRALK